MRKKKKNKHKKSAQKRGHIPGHMPNTAGAPRGNLICEPEKAAQTRLQRQQKTKTNEGYSSGKAKGGQEG